MTGTPLHDGAVVIRDGVIVAAGCVLPLSNNLEMGKDMGTRHRAGLGMSENSDAIVVIVSEETGIISMAKNGVLIRRLTVRTCSICCRRRSFPLRKPRPKRPRRCKGCCAREVH